MRISPFKQLNVELNFKTTIAMAEIQVVRMDSEVEFQLKGTDHLNTATVEAETQEYYEIIDKQTDDEPVIAEAENTEAADGVQDEIASLVMKEMMARLDYIEKRPQSKHENTRHQLEKTFRYQGHK